MEARRPKLYLTILFTFFIIVLQSNILLFAADGVFRTPNFIVSAPTPALAKEIGLSAEAWRKKLALQWIGQEMPNWGKRCPLYAKVASHLGAGGETSFVFDQGQVFGWRMNVQGSRERVLDSVLPHEITHTIFACYFRKPLPRWADEGACTTVEHSSEVRQQEALLIEILKTGRGIPMDHMFSMTEYPRDVLPLYAQGHSVATLLIERRGKGPFLNFLSEGMQSQDWNQAIKKHYGYQNLDALQISWMAWVRKGRPRLSLDSDLLKTQTQIASQSQPIGPRGTGEKTFSPKPLHVAMVDPFVKATSLSSTTTLPSQSVTPIETNQRHAVSSGSPVGTALRNRASVYSEKSREESLRDPLKSGPLKNYTSTGTMVGGPRILK